MKVKNQYLKILEIFTFEFSINDHPYSINSGYLLFFWNHNNGEDCWLGNDPEDEHGLLLSGPKSSFQMKVNFAFHLEIKVPESGGRV